MDKMKAIVCTKYGAPEVLVTRQMDKPTPGKNELLIRVSAASVTAADGMMRRGSPVLGRLFIGLSKPKNPIPGTGFSGVIEAIGKDVTLYHVGDQVFGESIFGHGTSAEYTCVAEDGVVAIKPANMTNEEAAVVCDGALTSMNFLKVLAKIKSGHKVLINGASGSLGTAAVQLASHFGAEVTGVCSTGNLEMVRALGADHVIDYTQEDFTNSEQSYDIIYDTVGKSSFSNCKRLLTRKGIYISPVLGLPLLLQMIMTSMSGQKKALFSATGMLPVSQLRGLLSDVIDVIKAGKLVSVIDKIYLLEQIVEAHTYIDKGRKRGNVILTVQ